MNIDFLLDAEPFDKMVVAYIQLQQTEQRLSLLQRSKKEVLLLNSVLVHLAGKKTGLAQLLLEVKYALEVNSGDRTCLRRAAQLFVEVIRRSQYIVGLTAPQHIIQIFQLSCEKAFITVSGNDFISLINQLSSCIDLALPQFRPVIELLFSFTTGNKLQIISYRQQTRLCLYKILLRILKFYPNSVSEWSQKDENEKRLIERCVNAGQGEKDPRNIGCVFELYLRLFELFHVDKLSPFKTSMFQNLEAYYPIQFVGDEDNEEHKKINVKQITYMLDQCLCHPFFGEQTWELLSTKTAAAPISKFVPTLLLYLQKRRLEAVGNELVGRLKNLLIRLSEESYIDEEYTDDNNDLGSVFVKLLDLIFCREDGSFSLQSYNSLLEWLGIMVGKVVDEGCKNPGVLMGIFKTIILRGNQSRFSTLIYIFRCYSIRTLLKLLTQERNLVPKIGLAIVAVGSLTQYIQSFNELLGLLVLKVGSLYAVVDDDIKMLLLKTLLEVYNSCPNNRTMIRKVNDSMILKDCLSRAEEAFKNSLTSNQTFLIKAFIDFVGVVYVNETELLIQNIKGINYEVESYLLCRLWQSLTESNNVIIDKVKDKQEKVICKLNFLLDQMKQENEKEGLFQGLKILRGKELWSLCLKVSWPKKQSTYAFVFDLLMRLKEQFRNKELQQTDQSQYPKLLMEVNSKNVISNLFSSEFTAQKQYSSEQQLWRYLSSQQTTAHFPLVNKFNQIDFNSFQFQPQFVQSYAPTFIHWQWQYVSGLQNSQLKNTKIVQLLRHLPQKLLLRDSKQIVEFLLKDSSLTSTLFKVVKNIDVKTIKDTGIVAYCLKSIHAIDLDDKGQSRKTESSLCLITILINIFQREKEEQLKNTLLRETKLLKKLAQHRKRPIRQASRKLLSLMQQ